MRHWIKITKDNFHLVQSGVRISVSLGSLYTHTLKEKSKSHKDYWLLTDGGWVTERQLINHSYMDRSVVIQSIIAEVLNEG